MLNYLICMAGAGGLGLPVDFSSKPPEGLPPLIRYEPLRFPESLRLSSITDGYALVMLTIEPAGKVDDAVAIEASHPAFGDTVIEGLSAWRFAESGSSTVPRRELIQFDFRRQGLVESLSHRDASKSFFTDTTLSTPAIRTVAWEEMERQPERTVAVMPAYPRELLAEAPRGFAVVSYVIDTTGAVRVPAVIDSSDARFGEEALKAVRQWRFTAPTQDGHSVNVRMTRSFNFGGKTQLR